jgi:hypothetical protein
MAIREARQRLQDRDAMETVLQYAPHIALQDQQLLASYFESHFSLYELAHIHKTTRSIIRRRIRSLLSRLSDPMFRAVVRYGNKLPTQLATVARARYVQGHCCARIEKDHGLTHPQARHRLRQAKVMLVQFTLQEIGQGDIAQMLAGAEFKTRPSLVAA